MTVNFCYWYCHDEGITPFVVGDDGQLVRTNWGHLARFFNAEYESGVAALEFWS